MDYFLLMRTFWDFAFENPEKIKPTHCALYAFIVEHCNRLGWKSKFGLPTTMAKDAIGIRSYNTYIQTLNELVDFGFIEMLERSKNQYSSNIVALSKFDKALDKALDKAFIKHDTKQSESTIQSNSSIDKQYTNIPIYHQQTTNSTNDEEAKYLEIKNKILDYQIRSLASETWVNDTESQCKIPKGKLPLALQEFTESKYTKQKQYNNINEFKTHFVYWVGSIRNVKAKKANQ